MPFTVTMPKLSPTMEEGTIAKWHKKVGDYAKASDLLLEIATDKATIEFNAIDEGYLRKILVEEGGQAGINQAIAIFTEDANESIEGYVPEGIVPKKTVEMPKEETKVSKKEEIPEQTQNFQGLQQPKFEPFPPLQESGYQKISRDTSVRLKASPLARKIAKEKNLDLSSVKGTGPGGRIVKKDLDKALPEGDFSFDRKSSVNIPAGTYKEEILSPMRKVVSRRLQESKTFIPHFYVTQKIDAQALSDFRDQLKNLKIMISFNDCVVKASAFALKKHPNINSGFNSVNQTIVYYQTIDIAVAVSLKEGLITPIVRYVDCKNLGEISTEIRSLAKKAKIGKLGSQEYQGGSFTISNLGMYGIENFQAIINPPQSSILAVGAILDTPIVKKGMLVAGKTMNLTLSVDHRVVDGVAAAEFLNTIKFYLENPVSLLL